MLIVISLCVHVQTCSGRVFPVWRKILPYFNAANFSSSYCHSGRINLFIQRGSGVCAAGPVASLRRNSGERAIALRARHGSIFEKQNRDAQKTGASEGERRKAKSAGTYCEDERRTNIRGRATAAAAQVVKLLFPCYFRKIRRRCPCQRSLFVLNVPCIHVYTRPNRSYVIYHPCTQQS